MKKLCNTKGELKKSVAYKKAYSIDFHIFHRLLMISSHRIPPIAIYVSSGHSASASFGKGERVDEESNKKA